jgi:hypothetical protein
MLCVFLGPQKRGGGGQNSGHHNCVNHEWWYTHVCTQVGWVPLPTGPGPRVMNGTGELPDLWMSPKKGRL